MKRSLNFLGAITAFALLLTVGTKDAAAFSGDFAAVGCTGCHTTGGAPWFTGGTSAPEHQKHAGDRFIACSTCHTATNPLPARPLTSVCGTCHANKIFSGPANPLLADQHAAKGVVMCNGCHGTNLATTTGATTSTTAAATTTTQVGATTTVGSTTTTTVAAAGFAAGCGVGCHSMPVNKGSTAYFATPGVNACSASFPAKFASMGAYSGMSAAQVQAAVNAICGGGTATTTTAAATTTTAAATTTTTGSTTTTTAAAAGFAAGCGVGCHSMPVNKGSTAYFATPGVNACSATFPAKFGSMGAYSGMSAAQVQAAVNAICGGGGTTTTAAATTTTGSTTTTTVAAAGFAAGCGVGCHSMPVNKGSTAYFATPGVNACSASFPAKFASMGAYSGMSAAQVQAAVNAICGGGGATTTAGGTTTTGSTTTTTMATGGAGLYNSYCASCHTGAAPMGGGRQVVGARTCSINASITGTKNVFPTGVPAMAFLKGLLTAAQIQSIADHLNTGAVTGQQRYITACAGCHGIDARGGRVGENVRGASASETSSAIRSNEGGMGIMNCLPSSDLSSIGAYLQGNMGTTTTTRASTTTTRWGTTTTTRPSTVGGYPNGAGTCAVTSGSHIALLGKAGSLQRLHMPGYTTPLISGCTSCHGADLKGTTMNMGCSVTPPSCTTCHGAGKWDSMQKKYPVSHTEREDGFYHMPGKSKPFVNGCTTCHGADLRGGNARSCYTCHGKEWD